MKSILLTIFSLLIFSVLNAQTIYTKTDTINVNNDTILVSLPDFEADSVIWQISNDKNNWINFNDSLYTSKQIKIIPKELNEVNYIRAKVFENTCEPSYSDTMLFINYDIVEDISASIDSILPESIGLTFKDDLLGDNSTEDIETLIETRQVLTSIIDTLNKHNQLEDLTTAIENLLANSATSNFISEDQKHSFSCDVANFGLGYAKGVELDLSVGGGIAYGIGLELEALGGGGVEVVYDFVNLTSQIYVFTFCGIESAVILGGKLQAVLEAGLGFTGYITWLMNIPYLENPQVNMFADPVRTYSLNFTVDVKAVLGLELGVSAGFTHDIDYHCSDLNLFSDCSDLIFSSYKTDGVIGITISAGLEGQAAVGAELSGGIAGSVVGSCRKGIDNTFTDYVQDKSKGNRKVAGLKMALDLLSPISSNGLFSPSTPIDIPAAAAAIVYSQMDFSDCPKCGIPYVETLEIVEESSDMIQAVGEILHDGNTEITRKGFLLGNQPNPNIEDQSTYDGLTSFDHDLNQFSSYFTVGTGKEIKPGKEYYIKTYATNKFGTTYGKDIFYQAPTDAPQVDTYAATLISSNTATLNGEVTSDGGSPITQRGFYWSKTDQTPDAGDNVEIVNGTTGSYSKEINGLEVDTKYYFRAFATNSEGTSRGAVKNFTTEEDAIAYGSFTDPRDNTTYKTVTIGDQTWMAENLKYLPSVSAPSSGSTELNYYYVYDYKGTNISSAKSLSNYHSFGVLYNWPAANSACPTGWHLPSDSEWKQLEKNLGMSENDVEIEDWRGTNEGTMLKAKEGWLNNGNGTDVVGYSGLPGGYRDANGLFGYKDQYGYWWGTTQSSSTYAWDRTLRYNESGIRRHPHYKGNGFSVRCIEGESQSKETDFIIDAGDNTWYSLNLTKDINYTLELDFSAHNFDSDGGEVDGFRQNYEIDWGELGSFVYGYETGDKQSPDIKIPKSKLYFTPKLDMELRIRVIDTNYGDNSGEVKISLIDEFRNTDWSSEISINGTDDSYHNINLINQTYDLQIDFSNHNFDKGTAEVNGWRHSYNINWGTTSNDYSIGVGDKSSPQILIPKSILTIESMKPQTIQFKIWDSNYSDNDGIVLIRY